MKGYVYVMLAPEVNRVKIGWSASVKSVWQRFVSVNCSSPCEIELHSAKHHDNVLAAETALHKRFRHAHVKGEWFDSSHPKVARWMHERELQGMLWAQPQLERRGRPIKVNSAMQYLINLFEDGEPRLARDVIENITDQDIASKRTIETAKAQLGIISTKIGNEWWWVQA